MINEIAEDFEKNSCSDKIKRIKLYAKNVLPNYKKLKTHNEN